MKDIPNPCENCKDRKLGCHCSCKKHKAHVAIQREMKRRIAANTKLSYFLFYSHRGYRFNKKLS